MSAEHYPLICSPWAKIWRQLGREKQPAGVGRAEGAYLQTVPALTLLYGA